MPKCILIRSFYQISLILMEPNHPKTAKLHNKLFKVIVTVGAGKEERVLTDMGSKIAMYTGMKCETPFVFYEDDTEEK